MDDKMKEVMGLIAELESAALESYLVSETCSGYEVVSARKALEQARENIESKLRELVPVWLPIESAEKPAIGANGFGERILLRVDCGDGTLKSTKIGWWCDKWMMDTGGSVKENGYRAIGWMPLP